MTIKSKEYFRKI